MNTPNPHAPTSDQPRLFDPLPRPGVARLILDLFSSVKLGIVLMTLLFIYATVGSAGIVYPTRGEPDFSLLGLPMKHEMLRQWPAFELTEFEWFHTPLFNAIILLICLNIIITTFRKIRFSLQNLGVWMIHTGIIILSVGSFVYFGTKYEGDTAVLRRVVTIDVPGAERRTIAALPGTAAEITTPEGVFRFRVAGIDPSWELRTESDLGKRAYAVSVSVQTPATTFVRQLLAGYPQYTEDVIPGKGRVKKLEEFAGKALVDDSIALSLAPAPQTLFWIKDSAALVARDAGTREWSQRVIQGLPRYNDYGGPANDPTDPRRNRTLDIVPSPPSNGHDPLQGISARITGFLRYAIIRPDHEPDGPEINPLVDVEITLGDRDPLSTTLLARDQKRRSALGGNLTFDWVNSADELNVYSAQQPRELTIRLPEHGFERVIPFTLADIAAGAAGPFVPMGDSGFEYRIAGVVDRFPLSDGTVLPRLDLEIKTPEGQRLERWIFEDPARIRDLRESAPADPLSSDAPDPRIQTVYAPGKQLPPLAIVAGPGLGLHLFTDDGKGDRRRIELEVGAAIEPIPGLSFRITRLFEKARAVTRPIIVPPAQRDRDADTSQLFALVRLELASGSWREERWLPFHRYSFDEEIDPTGALGRHEPATFDLPSGKRVEIMIARERRPLPNPVLLDDFHITAHVGGFTGRVSSVRDWNSVLRFQSGDSLSQPLEISTNDPAKFGDLWFFQAFWDPPRVAQAEGELSSAGLNFTGLGVGNRQGVFTQLAGCTLSVIGMIYAFYIKPIIRRRRRQAVLADMESGATPRPARPRLDDTPITTDGGPPALNAAPPTTNHAPSGELTP